MHSLKSPLEFSKEIEERAASENRRIYEVLSEYLEENDIDFAAAVKLLSRSIIEKMEMEYREDGYFKPSFSRRLNTLEDVV